MSVILLKRSRTGAERGSRVSQIILKKGDDEKDCAWVASHPSEARCLVRGEDDTLAKDACPSACAPQ